MKKTPLAVSANKAPGRVAEINRKPIVLEAASRQGIDCQTCKLSQQDLARADEIFITNSLIGFGGNVSENSLVLSNSWENLITDNYIDRGKWGVYLSNSG